MHPIGDPALRPRPPRHPPDIDVRWGESASIPYEPPPGRVLARVSFANGTGYTHTETETGYTLRFHATCEFWIDRHRRSIRAHLHPSVSPDIVPVLLIGNVVAFLLTLAGECVLHASGVEIGGSALAFVGGAGMGKSTLAALFCARGAGLITDDLLRLQPDGDSFRCFHGPSEIRLRSTAAALADRFAAPVTGPTADQRLAIRLDNPPGSKPRLRAIVIPHASRIAETVSLERLTPLQALLCLARCPRILGWQASEPIRRQFQAFGRVAKRVPVCETEIPWGPPFAPDLPTQLLWNLGIDGSFAEMPE